MGGILSPSKENEIVSLIRQDKPIKLKEFLVNNNIDPDSLYTKRKRTLIQLCCYFSSPKCLSKLIEMNYDYNKKELSNNYTPLYIVCKFNCLQIVKILLSKEDCKILQKNNDNYNEFEIAFLKGNYDICYYLLFEYKKNNQNNKDTMKLNQNKNKEIKNIYNEEEKKNKIETDNVNEDNEEDEENEEKENNENNNVEIDLNQPYQKFFFSNDFNIDNYISLQSTNQFPLFNMKLFYASLINKVPPDQCKSFAADRKRTKDLLTKIPDPNETWGHFFKRIANMELYNPPLVDRRNVSEMNSIYMNTQMKLLENEYGVKMSYYKHNEETKNMFDDDEEEMPIIKVQNTEKKNLKEEVQDESQFENGLKESENKGLENNNIMDVKINKKRNKERKPEEIKIGSNDNVCVLNVTNNSSGRNIKEKIPKENENE